MKFKILYFSLILAIYAIVQQACKKEKEAEYDKSSKTNEHAPKFPSVDYVYNGTGSSSNTNKRIKLGRVLFYESYMSFNNLMSCGSCHNQSKRFANNLQFDKGVKGNILTRNTPGIVGNASLLFWDGRTGSMDELVLKPVQNHNEMLQEAATLCDKLKSLPYYSKLFQDAFGDSEITLGRIQGALASFCNEFENQITEFEASLNSSGSTINSQLLSLNPKQRNGFDVFTGKGQCTNCHKLNEASYAFNNSLVNTGLDVEYTDNGLSSITGKESDKGKYKIPSLRNVTLTAPYMHDGRFKTLREVIDFYDEGVQLHKNLSPFLQNGYFKEETFVFGGQTFTDEIFVPDGTVRKLNLTKDEKENLIEFLKMFTDKNFINDPRYSNPF